MCCRLDGSERQFGILNVGAPCFGALTEHCGKLFVLHCLFQFRLGKGEQSLAHPVQECEPFARFGGGVFLQQGLQSLHFCIKAFGDGEGKALFPAIIFIGHDDPYRIYARFGKVVRTYCFEVYRNIIMFQNASILNIIASNFGKNIKFFSDNDRI